MNPFTYWDIINITGFFNICESVILINNSLLLALINTPGACNGLPVGSPLWKICCGLSVILVINIQKEYENSIPYLPSLIKEFY